MAADALIVSMARRGPGQMLGMEGPHAAGMGSAASVLDTVTGGEYSKLSTQLDSVEFWLKISIFASCVAGVAGLAMLFRRR
jgi:hypothetical protein